MNMDVLNGKDIVRVVLFEKEVQKFGRLLANAEKKWVKIRYSIAVEIDRLYEQPCHAKRYFLQCINKTEFVVGDECHPLNLPMIKELINAWNVDGN